MHTFRTFVAPLAVAAALCTSSGLAAALQKTYATKGQVYEFNPTAGDGTARPMLVSGIMGALGCGALAIGLADEQKLLTRCQQVTPPGSSWPETCDPSGLVVALKERYGQNWVYGALGLQEAAFAEMLNAAALYGAPSAVPLFGRADRWATLIKYTVDFTLKSQVVQSVYFYSAAYDPKTQLHEDGLFVVSGAVFRGTYYRPLTDPTLAPADPFRGKYVFAHDPPADAPAPLAVAEVERDPSRGAPLIGDGDVMTEELAEALALDALDLEGLLDAPELARVRDGVADGAWAVDGEWPDGAPWRYFVVPLVEPRTGDVLAYVGLSAEDGAFEQLHVPRAPERVRWTAPQEALAAARSEAGPSVVTGGALRWSPCVAGEACAGPLRPAYTFVVGEGPSRRRVRVPLARVEVSRAR